MANDQKFVTDELTKQFKLGNLTQAQKDRLKCAVHTAAQRILSDISNMKTFPEFDVQLNECDGRIVFVLTDRLPFCRTINDVEPIVQH